MSVVNMLPNGGTDGITAVFGPTRTASGTGTQSVTVTANRACYAVVTISRTYTYGDGSVSYSITANGTTQSYTLSAGAWTHKTHNVNLAKGGTLTVSTTCNNNSHPAVWIVATGKNSIQ